jgi:hypothetical protein
VSIVLPVFGPSVPLIVMRFGVVLRSTVNVPLSIAPAPPKSTRYCSLVSVKVIEFAVSGGRGCPAMIADWTFQTPSVFGASGETPDSFEVAVLGAAIGVAVEVEVGAAVVGGVSIDAGGVASGLQPKWVAAVKDKNSTIALG